jgi:DNA mismatch repair protein MutL
MSDIIRLLPDSVANQIAAGEVIQRPASVVKELVENAIDAEATEVHVLVTDAGKTCIQVIDNGKGMSQTDARLAFERHATSKIRQAADLFNLHTMGFRGEALASVAAVAEVELKTRMASEELGTRIVIAASKLQLHEAVSCPQGCNFSIKNLFFNVPARRKFLKSNLTEYRNIVDEFQRIALVHPEVAFYLYHNDVESFNLPVTALRGRIVSIFGKRINKELLSVEVDTTLVRLTGFVAKPETSAKSGAHQYFFVNGRYMFHPYFRKAVLEAYEQLIPTGEQVSYFLYFEVDPANIDVNIPPTKTEIKFENEQAIRQIVFAAVKEALGRFNAVPSIDFNTEGRPDIPTFDATRRLDPPEVHYNAGFDPFRATSPSAQSPRVLFSPHRADAPVAPDEETPAPAHDADEPTMERGGSYFQFKGRYILTSVQSGLLLIDQHRAHLRVLFEQYRRQIEKKQGVSQGVLFPEIIELTLSEAAVLETILDEVAAIGFDLTPMGGGSYAVNGIPADIEGLQPSQLIRTLLHSAMEKGVGIKEEVQTLLALTMARAAAIVYGQVLTQEEMANLTDQLFACATPTYTPDGAVILSIIKEEQIMRLFAR